MLYLLQSRVQKDRHGHYLGKYRCICGTEKLILEANVNSGNTKSCGCLLILLLEHRKLSGKRKTPEYRSWASMKTRCLNPNMKGYKYWGGRGITICDKWIDSFDQFHADMGPRPLGTTLDRIDNDGNYEPDNCKWSTSKEQNNNNRRTKT